MVSPQTAAAALTADNAELGRLRCARDTLRTPRARATNANGHPGNQVLSALVISCEREVERGGEGGGCERTLQPIEEHHLLLSGALIGSTDDEHCIIFKDIYYNDIVF